MATTTELYTYADVLTHNTKDNLWMVVHDKVYDVGKFIDEHPGGEEVMMDVGGEDATEAFEDVGHSDEAREILSGFLVGDLKRSASDPKPAVFKAGSTATDTAGGIPAFVYVLLAVLVAGAAGYYMKLQS